MLTKEVLDYLDRSVLCWLATIDADGWPNVSPKEMFAPFHDRYLVIANIASPNSVRNIDSNPRVCVSMVDVFAQRGFKLRGQARIARRAGQEYPLFEAILLQKTKGVFPIRSIICVDVDEVTPITAPSYHLFPGTTEESQRRAAMAIYGVQPASGDEFAPEISRRT